MSFFYRNLQSRTKKVRKSKKKANPAQNQTVSNVFTVKTKQINLNKEEEANMEKSKVKTLLIACVTIMLCAAMIIGGTYALWSDNVTVNNHLTAGTLKVKLERVSLTKTYLDSQTGYLTTSEPDTTVVDFSGSTTENVFGLSNYATEDVEKIVPGAEYEARLKITNNGDVAFTYEIIIVLKTASNELAEQLKVYVDGEDKGYLSEFINDGQAVVEQQAMAKTDLAKEFTVKLAFEDLSANNDAKEQSAEFDLLVKAVQATQAAPQGQE